jgi:hypothetical protein
LGILSESVHDEVEVEVEEVGEMAGVVRQLLVSLFVLSDCQDKQGVSHTKREREREKDESSPEMMR